jgi:hypothetical protein
MFSLTSVTFTELSITIGQADQPGVIASRTRSEHDKISEKAEK